MNGRKRQGSVLVVVLLVLMLCSLAVLALTSTLQDYSRMQHSMRDELQAYYTAEAGVLEVVSWFNTFGNPVKTWGAGFPLFQRNQYGEYVNLLAQLPPGTTIRVPDNILNQYLVLRNTSGTEVGRVTSLEIFNPAVPPPNVPNFLCAVRSLGEARFGQRKQIVLYLRYQNLKIDGAPGVIVTEQQADFSGNTLVHWGEVWAKRNLLLQSYSQMKDLDLSEYGDPWLKYRTEANLIFDSTWPSKTNWFPQGDNRRFLIDAPNTGDYVDFTAEFRSLWPGLKVEYPCVNIGVPEVASKFGSGDYPALQQQQSLNWPAYDYYAVKEIALRYGRYYTVNNKGELFLNGDPTKKVTDLAGLNHPDASKVGTVDSDGSVITWEDLYYDVVFVDTLDRQPPRPDGSNMLPKDFRMSGNGLQWKGLYYICHDVLVKGVGSGMDGWFANPRGNDFANGPVPQTDYYGADLSVFLDGLLVVRGNMQVEGNNVVYGSIYAERGYSATGGGTIEVWYNSKLKFGFPAAIANRVDLALWKIES